MATAPVKSQQPLHNFSISFPKWGNKNPMNNHRCRRPADPPPPPPLSDNHHQQHPSPCSEPESDCDFKNDKESDGRKQLSGSRTARNRFNSLSSCSLLDKTQKQVLEKERGVEVANDDEAVGEQALVQKPWNLRPRRCVSKGVVEIGGCSSKNGELPETVVQQSDGNVVKSMRLRGLVDTQDVEKKEKKPKLWISLSKEEIEEDIFAMTGSKPARRPKKRPRNVQKQLDSVFPGLWLVGLSSDAFRIPDTPAKK